MKPSKDQERIKILWEALMDIAAIQKTHECKCQCANNCIEAAQDAIKIDSELALDQCKGARCFSFHLPEMDRLFAGMERWDWRSKKHLTQEWKELADSIRVSMNFSPAYGTGDILHRWFGKWLKYKKKFEGRPILDGSKLVEVHAYPKGKIYDKETDSFVPE